MEGFRSMNDTLRQIIGMIGVLVATEVISQLSRRVYKKYQIVERKISLLVFALLFFGLILIVLPLVYWLISDPDGISIYSMVCYSSTIIFGILLLSSLVIIVVRKDEIFPVETKIDHPQRYSTKQNLSIIQAPVIKPHYRSWVYMIGGLLLAVACVYLFIAYGPANDPPTTTAQHKQLDVYINYFCASVFVIGIIIFAIGFRKLIRR